MNRKGFAISALIYGLSIMGMLLMAILIGVMSVNRTNNRKLSATLEEDLNRFSRTETTFSSSSNPDQPYTVPKYEAGWYKIELMGAAGNGGYGAYTSGVIELKEKDNLYFIVGKKISGKGGNTKVEIEVHGDRKIVIMEAAGGGSNSGTDGGILMGYKGKSTGGKVNITASEGKNYNLKSDNLIGYTSTPAQPGTFHGKAKEATNDEGGISYIAGYAGCKGSDGFSGIMDKDRIDEEDTEIVPEDRAYYFVDGMMIPGVNNGDGWAKIERVVKKTSENQTLTRKNAKLTGVNKIMDCADSAANVAKKIIAVYKGKIVVNVNNPTGTGNCREVTFASTDIDEIAVWHGQNGKDIKNTISTNKGTIKGNAQANTETPTGFRISAYQYDSTIKLPQKGNYYIMPVLSENMVLTAAEKIEDEDLDITVDYIKGLQKQRWSIEFLKNKEGVDETKKLTTNNGDNGDEYSIVELARFKALAVKKDLNIENEHGLCATEAFNRLSRNPVQIWEIKPIGDGTYTITTPIPPHKASRRTGNILPNMASSNKRMIIGFNNATTERFKLIATDYSGS